MKLSGIALRNVFRNTRRSVLSVIALAVAAMTITLMFSLLEGITADVKSNSWDFDAGEVRIRNRLYDRYEYLNPVQYVVPDYLELADVLRGHPAVHAVSPRIRVPSAAFRGERQIAAVGLGLDMETEPRYQNLERIVATGRLPMPGTSEAIIGEQLAQELGVGVGDTATFLTQTRQRGSNAFTVDVVGIARFPVHQLNRSTYILPLESAGRYMRMHGAAGEILLKSNAGDPQELAEEINRLLVSRSSGEDLHAVPWTEISGGYAYLRMANVVYRLIALFFFLLASTVIISTTMMIVHERTREIGTLAALGMHDRELVRLFFLESAYLGAFGAALGVLLGIGIVYPLSRMGIDFGATMEMVDMDISTVLFPVLNLRSTVVVFLFGFLVAAAATFPSARRAAKLRPVEALRAN